MDLVARLGDEVAEHEHEEDHWWDQGAAVAQHEPVQNERLDIEQM